MFSEREKGIIAKKKSEINNVAFDEMLIELLGYSEEIGREAISHELEAVKNVECSPR